MNPTNWSRLAATALLALAAACADSTSPVTRVSDSDMTYDAANDAGQAAALDVAQMSASESDAGVPSAVAAPSGTTRCTYSAATGRFSCPTSATPEGLILDRSFAFFSGGAAQPAYDASATDSINFQWTLGGTLQNGGWRVWIDHDRSLTVSGLAGAETQRSWSGTGSRSDSSLYAFESRARKTKITGTSTVDHVSFRLPRSTYPYPQSGTITHDAHVTAYLEGAAGSTTRSADRHVVITFDGTRTASMLVGSTSCSLDLPTRIVTCGGR